MKIKTREYNRLVKTVLKLKSKVIDLELSRATTATTLTILRKQLQEVLNHDSINQ
jgi:hypothetical protein